MISPGRVARQGGSKSDNGSDISRNLKAEWEGHFVFAGSWL